jgi:hypothetical protein
MQICIATYSVILPTNCKENLVDTFSDGRETSPGIKRIISFIVFVPVFTIELSDVLGTSQMRKVVLADLHISKDTNQKGPMLTGALVGSCPFANGTTANPASSPVLEYRL